MYSSIRQKLNEGLKDRFHENNLALYHIIDSVQSNPTRSGEASGQEFVTALKIALLHKN